MKRVYPWLFRNQSTKIRDALLDFHLRIVAQLRARLGNVGERDGHVAGLQRLAVNHRLFAERGFEQFNQLAPA